MVDANRSCVRSKETETPPQDRLKGGERKERKRKETPKNKTRSSREDAKAAVWEGLAGRGPKAQSSNVWEVTSALKTAAAWWLEVPWRSDA